MAKVEMKSGCDAGFRDLTCSSPGDFDWLSFNVSHDTNLAESTLHQV